MAPTSPPRYKTGQNFGSGCAAGYRLGTFDALARCLLLVMMLFALMLQWLMAVSVVDSVKDEDHTFSDGAYNSSRSEALAIAIGVVIMAYLPPGTSPTHRQLVLDSIENKRSYAKKHGYGLDVYTKILDPARKPAWSKVLAWKLSLSKYDYIWAVDFDSIIMNDTFLLESVIHPYPSQDLLFPRGRALNINTGSFLIRQSNWSFAFLDRVYGMPDAEPKAWWENAAIIQLYDDLSTDTWQHVALIPQRVMNSYTDSYNKGNFLVHFAGAHDFSWEKNYRKYEKQAFLNR